MRVCSICIFSFNIINRIIQKIRIFSDDYKKEYPVEQYITQNKSDVKVYTEIANDILKN